MKYKNYQNILEDLDILSINIARLKDVNSNYIPDPESVIYFHIEKMDSVGFDIHEFRVIFNQYKSECERARINMASEVDLYFIKCRDELHKQRRLVSYKLREFKLKFPKGGIVPKENIAEYTAYCKNKSIPQSFETTEKIIKGKPFKGGYEFNADFKNGESINIDFSQEPPILIRENIKPTLEQRLKEVQEKYRQYEKSYNGSIEICKAAFAMCELMKQMFHYKPKYDIKGILRY